MRLALVIALLPTIAHADAVADLEAKGEQLGKLGNWSQAIDAFKQADARQPTAKHACLIGLAYVRRELWPQAELFFARCRGRASTSDPLPEWLDDAQKQLDEKLTAANTVAVSFAITPGSAAPQISVSSFAPDEKFAPQTIHLAPGTYTVRVTAENYAPQQRELVIAAAGPRTTTVDAKLELLHPPASRIPPILIVGGSLVLGAAIAVDIFAVYPARDAAAKALTSTGQRPLLDSYTLRRNIDVALYATGIAAIAAGYVLRATVLRTTEVTASVGRDHAFVGIAWSR